jgi:hypothetical protein
MIGGETSTSQQVLSFVDETLSGDLDVCLQSSIGPPKVSKMIKWIQMSDYVSRKREKAELLRG